MADIMSHLEKLQKPSGRYLDPTVVARLQCHDRPRVLAQRQMLASAVYVFKSTNATESLSKAENRQSVRRIRKFSNFGEDPLMKFLNSSLSGSDGYPVLTSVLSAVGGLVSAGAGWFFTAATTGVNMAQVSHKVLARPGDEVWHIEEIGKDPARMPNKAVYVSAFFIVGPYRKQAPKKGWLIHEERHELALS